MKKKTAVCLLAFFLLCQAPSLIFPRAYQIMNTPDYNDSLSRFKRYDMSGGLSLGMSDYLNIGAGLKFNLHEIPFWSIKVDASMMPSAEKILFFEETGFVYNFYFEKFPSLSLFAGPSTGFVIKNSSSYFGFGGEAGADYYINEPGSASVFIDFSFLSRLYPLISIGIRFYY